MSSCAVRKRSRDMAVWMLKCVGLKEVGKSRVGVNTEESLAALVAIKDHWFIRASSARLMRWPRITSTAAIWNKMTMLQKTIW